MNQSLLNTNVAVITRVLDGGQRIELRLPKGGRVQCRNRGFEVGEVVCFTLDATGRNIIQIYPKDVADLKVAIAQDDMLQMAITEGADDPAEDDFTNYGQENESGLDSSGVFHRGGMEERHHYPIYPADHEDDDGPDDYSEGDPDASGETVDNDLYVLVESGGIPELVEDDSSPA